MPDVKAGVTLFCDCENSEHFVPVGYPYVFNHAFLPGGGYNSL
jgi:hypothetical protein